jgi:hypothetical protein
LPAAIRPTVNRLHELAQAILAAQPWTGPMPYPPDAWGRERIEAYLHLLMIAEDLLSAVGRDLNTVAGMAFALGTATRSLDDPAPLALALSPTGRRAAAAATATWIALHRTTEALAHPASVGPLSAIINPAAGHHPVCTDPIELQAAFRAGRRAWQREPYYDWRYGRRGERFTRSDSAWLAAIGRTISAGEQVAWLGRVLAARGMPRWLLEQHIIDLDTELTALTGDPAPFAPLREARLRLRSERLARMNEDEFEDLIAGWEERIGPEWAGRLRGMGAILAAAIADDRAGVPGALTSVHSWLADPERFPPPWSEAVQEMIRRAASGRPVLSIAATVADVDAGAKVQRRPEATGPE